MPYSSTFLTTTISKSYKKAFYSSFARTPSVFFVFGYPISSRKGYTITKFDLHTVEGWNGCAVEVHDRQGNG